MYFMPGIIGRDGQADRLEHLPAVAWNPMKVRIGIDGLSAYEVAVAAGFEGTRDEWLRSLSAPALDAAAQATAAADCAGDAALAATAAATDAGREARAATEAAASANEAVVQLSGFKESIATQVSSKADLDSAGRYVLPSQLDPLQGLQTGANTSDGYYSGSVPGLPLSIEMLFTTGADVSAAQRVATYTGQSAGSYWNAALDIAGGGMVATYGVSAPSVPVSSGTLYHVVMCKDYVQVNGVAYPLTGALAPSAITGFRVGRTTSDATPRIFNGTVHRLRVFNYSLSGAEALALWNGGRPAGYMLDGGHIRPEGVGVNLMRATQHPDLTDTAVWNNNYVASVWGEVGEFTAVKVQGQWGRLWQIIDGGVKAGQTYAFSCMVRRDATLETTETLMNLYCVDANITIHRATLGGRVLGPSGTNGIAGIKLSPGAFERLEVTFSSPANRGGNAFRVEFYANNSSTNTPCGVVYGYKLEKGDRASAWSPAPADVEAAGWRCVAEYLPSGLLPGGWRDTSGSGADLTAVGTPVYAYRPPQNYGPDFPFPNIEDQCSYGIEWDTAVSSPVCCRIGNMALHRELPVQSRMRGCLLSDEGEVVHYLDAGSWTAETRDGTAGQVMVEIPAHYRRFETEGTIRRCKLSEYPLPGYHAVPKMYISAYEAALERSSGKLCSVANAAPDFRGGNNNASWDGTYRSLLGRPATLLSRTALRAAARARRTGDTAWNCLDYHVCKTLFWLYFVEYANFNCQEAFNAQKNANGFAQGGLGAGVTTLEYATWSSFNNVCPFVPCGHTDALGNGSGEVAYVVSGAEGATLAAVYVPRYRGVENPFGHIWQWVDGINVKIKAEADGGVSQVYVASDPALYGDGEEDGYELRGEEARASGFVRELIFGPDGEIMPSTVGGGSTTYFCDYHYTGIPAATTMRGVMFGGYAMREANNGLASSNTSYAPSYASADVGTRLCYIPQSQNRQNDEQSVL